MFEIKFYIGNAAPEVRTCDMGELLPTIASILMDHERDHGKYKYQTNYTIQWRQVKE